MDTAFTPAHRGGSGEPLLLLHGFTDTWRTWELVLPALERAHDVLAITLAGHAGGPPIDGAETEQALVDAAERALDAVGWQTAHVVGNSLGGYVALKLAERGRAKRVVALAPAGGWAPGDRAARDTLAYFRMMQQLLPEAAPRAEQIVSTPEGRRRATLMAAERYEHIPPALLAHQIRGAAGCPAAPGLIAFALREGWSVDAERIACPLRFVWGTEDKLLHWPGAAVAYRERFPQAEWVELEGVGHCPQLDVPLETAELILGFTARSASPARAG
ncbi:MAG: alpha/beta fold hydrolase [Actinobacteria bacterium]|nr:alpha/beta fold hydrolase [Actinomycetota bacterium]